MTNTLQQNLEAANLQDQNKELFSETDLKKFNELITDEDTFKELIKGFEDEKTVEEIKKIPGLKEVLDAFVATKKNLANIFDTTYEEAVDTNKDLYEVCVLGAILTKGKVENADYKVLAKDYYESIKKIEANETLTTTPIAGTYETASSELPGETVTKIETATTTEAGKNITETSVTISAGADQRTMNLEKGKGEWTTKMEELKTMKTKFLITENQNTIEKLINELSAANIESQIIDQVTGNKTNTEQHGNRYLIAARIAEGFINVLNKLVTTPEPKLTTLSIDRANCNIGSVNADVPTDRDITISLDVKMETNTTITTDISGAGGSGTGIGGAGGTGGGGTKDDGTAGGTKTGGTGTKTVYTSTGGGKKVSGPNASGDIPIDIQQDDEEIAANEPTEDVEKPEIISLKKEISEQVTINGTAISREVDISNAITYENGIYTIAIKGYSGLEFAFDPEKNTLEIKASTGGVRKGLFLYDVPGKKISTTDDKAKIDIIPKFNSTKTIESLNKQLETNDEDGDKKADYKATKINGSSIDFEYGVKFIKDKTDETKTKIDKFTLNLDTENNIVTPDSQGEGQISQRKKVEGTITKDTDFVFDDEHKTESGKKVLYYMQTKTDSNGIPQLSIMNNIQERVTGAYESIYTEHKEMTNPEFKEIKDDFLANKIERIFVGTLNSKHSTDFQNNRKITKGEKKGSYNFSINFTKNDGRQQEVKIPFIMTIDNANNTRKYTFTGKKKSETIDNIVYDINTPTGTDGVPSIKMIENQEATLKNAEKATSNKMYSDIFSGEKANRGSDNNIYEVKSPAFSLGNIEFDGKGGYKRTIFFGEQKDANGNILLTGEEEGIVFYDQDHKIIKVMIKNKGKEVEIDFTDKDTEINMEDILEDEDGKNKGVVLKPGIVEKDGKKSVELNFKTPKEKDKNRQTTDLYLERIRDEKETIFTALKQLSKTLTGNVFMLPTIKNADETSYKTSKIVGPDGKGLYKRKLTNVYEKGRDKYLEQNIYCKAEGTGLVICDSEGNTMEKMYVIDYEKGDYYEMKVDPSDSKYLSVKKLDDVKLQDVAKIETEDMEYKNGKVAIELKTENIELLKSNFKDRYTFSNNKHEMCTINLDTEGKLDESALETGASKKPQIIEPNNVLFGSYQKYFAGDGRENLGIGESDYELGFKAIYEEILGQNKYSKEGEKNIIQVKLWSTTDKKYYYDYMAIKQNGKNNFSLEKLDGLEEAKEEMKRRLDNLVLLNKIQPSTKGDKLRGVKINNKDNASRLAYLKDKNSPVKITLTDSNKKTSAPIEITMKDYQKRTLTNNKDLELGEQKINCELEFKDNIPMLKMEVIEQENENQ